MLIRIRSAIRAWYSYDSSFHRELTRKISKARTWKDLDKLLHVHESSFNSLNMSALLKHLSLKHCQVGSLLARVYKEVEALWEKQLTTITTSNIRSITNIICYTSNLNYHQINHLFIQHDYSKYLSYMNHKQLVMLLTGLLRLNLEKECLRKLSCQQIIEKEVLKMENCGLLISLWRNLIKAGKSDTYLNDHLAKRVLDLQLKNINFADYAYLIYCVKEATLDPALKSSLFTLLKKYNQTVFYTSRLKIFQLSIMLDNLRMLQLEPSKEFFEVIRMQYLRNINHKELSLRSLANAYHSLKNALDKIQLENLQNTYYQFIRLLKKVKMQSQSINDEESPDFQSVISLFTEIIETTKNHPEQDRSYLNKEQFFQTVFQSIIWEKFETKYFQKFCYAIHLLKNLFPSFNIPISYRKIIEQNFCDESREYTFQQIQSMHQLLWHAGIRDKQLCEFFRSWLKRKQTQNKQIKSKMQEKCLLGRKKQIDCICLL